MPNDLTNRNIRKVAELIAKADALLITAGAGMGVDSGLPDFRGKDGFWRAYPALEKLGISFEQMAQPRWFFEDPATAWAFYGHRQQLYRETKPHDGLPHAPRLGAGDASGVFRRDVERGWAFSVRGLSGGIASWSSTATSIGISAGRHARARPGTTSRAGVRTISRRISRSIFDDVDDARATAAVSGVRGAGAAERADVRGHGVGPRCHAGSAGIGTRSGSRRCVASGW